MSRAPLKLTREAKLLLLLLLMVGLIGLWYVWTNNRAAEDLASQPPVTPVTGGSNPDTVPVTPNTPVAQAPGEGGSATPEGSLPVQPDPQVQVEEIPPFPTGEDASAPVAEEAPTEAAAQPEVPTGINPEGVVGAAPAANPFRPLALARDASAPAPSTAPSAPSTPRPSPDIIAAQPVRTPVASGPLSLNPIPGSDSVDVRGGDLSGSVLPIPEIPGADGGDRANVTPILPTTAPANPGPAVVQVPAPQPAGNPLPTPEAPRPPRPAPIAGVRVPGVTALPSAAPLAPGAPVTALPTPGTPQVLTELAPSGGAEPAQAAQNAAERYVQAQSLAFEAVVLGPVNTAIFRGKDGYVVVATGQTLPDSSVLVKEVTATGATLALGNDSTTLELDKR